MRKISEYVGHPELLRADILAAHLTWRLALEYSIVKWVLIAKVDPTDEEDYSCALCVRAHEQSVMISKDGRCGRCPTRCGEGSRYTQWRRVARSGQPLAEVKALALAELKHLIGLRPIAQRWRT